MSTEMKSFERASEIAFPIIFHTFKARDKQSDKIVEYKIQDLLEEDYENAVELMTADFTPEESFKTSEVPVIPENPEVPEIPEALAELRKNWRLCLTTKVSLGCYKCDGSDGLIGVNILVVYEKKDEPGDPNIIKTTQERDLYTLLCFIESINDVLEKKSTCTSLTDFGFGIEKSYTDRGIDAEFMKARPEILKALNIEVKSTESTVIESQKDAIEANYGEDFGAKFADKANDFPVKGEGNQFQIV